MYTVTRSAAASGAPLPSGACLSCRMGGLGSKRKRLGQTPNQVTKCTDHVSDYREEWGLETGGGLHITESQPNTTHRCQNAA